MSGAALGPPLLGYPIMNSNRVVPFPNLASASARSSMYIATLTYSPSTKVNCGVATSSLKVVHPPLPSHSISLLVPVHPRLGPCHPQLPTI